MRIIKWVLIYFGLSFAMSMISIPATAYLYDSKPTMEVFTQSPFVVNAKANTTYTVLLGTTNRQEPQPNFSAVNFNAAWVNPEGKAPLDIKGERGETQVSSTDRRYGLVKAVSVATFESPDEGDVKISVSGWTAPGAVVAVDHGFLRFFLVILLLGFLNVLLPLGIVALMYKKWGKRV